MGHIAPVVGAIGHTAGSCRAIEYEAIDTSAIDDRRQVVDGTGVRRMPSKINRSRSFAPSRHNAQGSERRNVHLSEERKTQTRDGKRDTKEMVEHFVLET
jgi:hypothetical protein